MTPANSPLLRLKELLAKHGSKSGVNACEFNELENLLWENPTALVDAAEKSERYREALTKIVEWNTDPITMRRLAKEALRDESEGR